MAIPQTIDLGLIRLEPDVRPMAVAPSGWTGRARLWLVAALIFLAPVALTGSLAPPPQESLTVVGTIALPSGGDFRLFADAVYTIGPATGGGSNIISYSGVRARWFLSVHATSDFIVLNEAAGTTLISFGSAAAVRGVDSATGHILWQRARARVASIRGDRVLLVQLTENATIYTWCVASTGVALWQRSIPPDWVISNVTDGSGYPAEHLIAVSPSGDVRDLHLDDAGTEGAGHLAVDPAQGSRPLFVLAVGGTLVVIQSSEKDAMVGGYETSSYTLLWRRRLGTHDGTIEPNTTMAPCGVVICQYEDADTTGVDPGTGVPLWTARSSLVTPVGDWLLVTPIGPSGFLSSTRMIDPHSGAALLRLAHWSVGSMGRDDALFVTPALTAETTRVADLRPGKRSGDPPALRSLGPVTEATSDCRAAGRYVACVTVDGRLKLWRRSTA